MKRKSWSKPHACIILRTGTKTSLLKLKVKVGEQGAVVVDGPGEAGDNYVLSRFHEKNKKKKRDETGRANHLQDIDEELFANGPDGLMPQEAHPMPDRRAKERPQEELAELQRQLDTLPFLTWQPGDMEVSPGTRVYYNSAKLCLVAGSDMRSPRLMFTNLLQRLLPEHVRHNPALSRTGERNTVQLPDNIQAAVTGFVQGITKGQGPKFDVNDTMRNCLYYGSHPRKREQNPAPARPREEGNGLPDPLAGKVMEFIPLDGPPPHQGPAEQPVQVPRVGTGEHATVAPVVQVEPLEAVGPVVGQAAPQPTSDDRAMDQSAPMDAALGEEDFFPHVTAPGATAVTITAHSSPTDGPALALIQMRSVLCAPNYLDACLS